MFSSTVSKTSRQLVKKSLISNTNSIVNNGLRVSLYRFNSSTTSTKYNTDVKFSTSNTKNKDKNNENKTFMKKFLLFSGFFSVGWFITQHFTFMDLLAMYKYDKLPLDDSKVIEYKLSLKNKLINLPILKQLKENGYMESFNTSSSSQLIDKTLNVPGGIFIDPQVFYNPVENKSCGIYHLGMKLTGYPFLVHGGVLATVLEDMMIKALNFEVQNSINTNDSKTNEKIIKLQKISLQYKFPTFANQFVVIRSVNLKKITNNVYEIEMDLMDQSGKRSLVSGKGKFSVN